MALLLSLKNKMLRELTAASFNPNHFKWRGDSVSYAGPGSAGLSYMFSWTEGLSGMYGGNASGCIMSPGDSELSCVVRCEEREIFQHFKTWVRALKRETSEPDLWKDARELGAVLAKVDGARKADASRDGVPLVGDERDRLLEAVETVRRLVEAKTETDEKQREGMKKTLDEIKGGSGAITRVFLIQTIVGIVITKCFEGVLTLENGQWLLAQLADALIAVKLFQDAGGFNALPE